MTGAASGRAGGQAAPPPSGSRVDAGAPLTVREVQPGDAEALAGVLNPIIAAGRYTVIDGPIPVEEERAYIERFPAAGVFLVAERGGDVVGFQNVEPFAGYTRAFDHVGVSGTFVRLDCLRTGVGRALSAATFAAAKAAGYRKLFTYVRADNPASLAFHRAVGFRVVGTAVAHARLGDRYVDEIIIERSLEEVVVSSLTPSGLGHDLLLGDGVVVGKDVVFGANVVVYDDTVIGDGCFIQDGAVLGKVPSLSPTSTAKRGELAPLVLGAGCVISTGAVVYRGTTLGPGCILGDYAGVRERCTLGEKVVVGRSSVVENDTTIGDFTKIQTNVYITAYMTIEDNCFIAPCVQTTNDNFMGRTEKRHELIKGATIRRGARVGGGVVLCPAVEIGEEAFIAAGAVVTKDAPAGKVLMGVPARVVRDVSEDELLDSQ